MKNGAGPRDVLVSWKGPSGYITTKLTDENRRELAGDIAGPQDVFIPWKGPSGYITSTTSLRSKL